MERVVSNYQIIDFLIDTNSDKLYSFAQNNLNDDELLYLIKKLIDKKDVTLYVELIKDEETKLNIVKYNHCDNIDSFSVLINIKDTTKLTKFIYECGDNSIWISALPLLNLSDAEIVFLLENKVNNDSPEELIKYLKSEQLQDKYIRKFKGELLKKVDFLCRKNDEEVDENIKTAILSNDTNYKKKLLKNEHVECNYKMDDITFGVELEASHINNFVYYNVKKLLKGWKIIKDGSVCNSIEVTSPVLHYNEHDLKELKFVCDYMTNNGFSINESCGGHIHIGAKYLNDAKSLKTLYYIFSNCEDLLNIIVNKQGSISRAGRNKYATNIYPSINENIDAINNCNNYIELINTLKDIQKANKPETQEKYFGLNALNIKKSSKNTIEFRFPNGELNYSDVLANVVLIMKLVQASKKLSKLDENDIRYKKLQLLGEGIYEDDKLDVLLSLLFTPEEDKQVYYDRYNTNKELVESNNYYVLNKPEYGNIILNKLVK